MARDFFPMVHGRDAVRVRGEIVEFGSSLARVTGHGSPVLQRSNHRLI